VAHAGGAPVVRIEAPGVPVRDAPSFIAADIAPGRGGMTLQIHARTPRFGELALLATPPMDEACAALDADASESGNASFSFGGALLVPFANRVPGELVDGGRRIRTRIGDKLVELAANWGGKRPGAARYAMHGLILRRRWDSHTIDTIDATTTLRGVLAAGDFGCGWPSSTSLAFEYSIAHDALSLVVTAKNVRGERTPIGIGWHPYFALPSADRTAARLSVPARERVVVNDPDELLPTGEIVPVADSEYDFTQDGGRELGSIALDDCFTALRRDARGVATAAVIDARGGYGLRIEARSPAIRAFQVYAPVDEAYVVVEPQYNLADPFGAVWDGRDTGMAWLEPGASTTYAVRLSIFVVD